MSQDLEQVGLDTVDQFITTWNTRDAELWAGSLNYPHVRPSPLGEVKVAQDKAAYIAGVDFNSVIATGWDHSEWDYKHVVQTSPNKIHAAGQWSRYDAEGNVILTTPITYICTLVEDHWGIQSRFGSDYADEETDTTELMTRGLNLVQDFVNHYNTGNRDACAELLNYPFIDVGIGALNITESSADFQLEHSVITLDAIQALQTGKLSMNVGFDMTIDGQACQGVTHINNRDDHLGMMAISFLDPNQSEE